ncbi:MAG: hypothetical protein GX560_04705 [Deinococcales bacterium]|nr:hypothetical protein [Deinococcales bacterium]
MYRTDRQPAWQRDVAWASALLLVLVTLAGTLLFSLARLSTPTRGPEVGAAVLRLTLRPGGEGSLVAVRTGAGYVPGQPLMLLPGLQVYADPSEVPTFTAADAVSRSAGVLADRLVRGGGGALLEALGDGALRRQFELALEGPVAELVTGALAAEMLPAGLDDGSRLADWRAQAAADPGQPVQPLVGVFVRLPVAQVQSMSDRELGAAVVAELAGAVMEGGLPAAQALVSNANLSGRLERGVDTVARARLHELFSAMLLAQQGEMEARLAEAQAAMAGAGADDDGLAGLLPAAEVAGLAPEQAEARVLAALAERAYDGGGELAAAQLTRAGQVERVRAVAPLLDAFGARAHGRYLLWTWLGGALALALLAGLVGFSRGLLRLVNPAVALLIGGGLGALALQGVGSALPHDAPLPLGAQAQGAFTALVDLAAHAVRSLPAFVLELPLRHYLIVGGAGALLVLLALVLWLLRGLRPRRRYYR